jgi:peptidoglycan L-alanyl-D-glutamate endopeptidase CwlK
MSQHLENLRPEFREKVEILLANCRKQGVVLRPFYGVRSLDEQARLWRQSRSRAEIERAIAFLQKQAAPKIAEILESVGPQIGRWATNALPGESWHQWGEAVDCFVYDEEAKKAVWSAKHEGYRIYGEEARKLGLVSGYFWQSQDAVHVQLRAEKVTKQYSWRQIQEKLLEN